MVTNTYKTINPIFRAQVLVDRKPTIPEECPFYGEHAVSYKQYIDGNKKYYRLKAGIKKCCYFSKSDCDPMECIYLTIINGQGVQTMNHINQAQNINKKFKDHYLLKDWYCSGKIWFQPCNPKDTVVLCGKSYDHAFYEDGRLITTSMIRQVVTKEDHKEIHTLNSIYWIYPEDVNDEYKEKYPDCYEQLEEGIWNLNK